MLLTARFKCNLLLQLCSVCLIIPTVTFCDTILASCLRITETPNDVVSAITSHDLWTAAQRVNTTNTPSSFIWSVTTSNRYVKLPLTFTNWLAWEPGNDDELGYCIALSARHRYKWYDITCTHHYHPVCEIDIA